MRTFTVQLDDAVAEKLSGLAAVRGVNVEYLIEAGASAIADELAEGDAFLDRIVWTPEDIAAIEEGIAQCERGETIPQEQFFAELRALSGATATVLSYTLGPKSVAQLECYVGEQEFAFGFEDLSHLKLHMTNEEKYAR